MSTIRTLADLHESSPYAWPGGYPVAFYDGAGIVLCYDCVEEELFAVNDDDIRDHIAFHADVEDGDQQYYGGVMCDGCQKDIVEAMCPECDYALFDGTPLLFANNVDASMMHRRCAAKLVTECAARRLPGRGVEIIPTKPTKHGWDNGTPWYATAGTVYGYR